MRWARDSTATFGPLEQAYVSPTPVRKRERQAELQARCPYDLDELTEWGDGEWIDWGQTLYHSPPERPSNVEMLAVCKYRQYERERPQHLLWLAQTETWLRELCRG